MAITDWPEEERPRERLLAKGADSLSDAELLAIFLRVGFAGRTAVDLARDLLDRFGSLQGLFAAPLTQLCELKGMGRAKYVQLQAILEMSRRALEEELRVADSLTSTAAVRRYLKSCLRARPYEVFMGLFMDGRHRLLAVEELFRGTFNHAQVYPREIARRALELNAAAMIVAHNHPSGSRQVSAADVTLTHHLQRSLSLLEIRLLDHFIVAGHQVVSMSEQGLLLE